MAIGRQAVMSDLSRWEQDAQRRPDGRVYLADKGGRHTLPSLQRGPDPSAVACPKVTSAEKVKRLDRPVNHLVDIKPRHEVAATDRLNKPGWSSRPQKYILPCSTHEKLGSFKVNSLPGICEVDLITTSEPRSKG